MVDERAALKCLAPRCSNYGTNLMCPPNVMPISEFKDILGRYRAAILLKIDSVPSGLPEEFAGSSDLSETWKIAASDTNKREQPSTPITEYIRALKDDWETLHRIISQIESICFAEGYHFAAGLSAGSCWLCDECVGTASGLPCRHPFRARPSMEAMGIDVVATARRAGMQMGFSPNAPKDWVGLILID